MRSILILLGVLALILFLGTYQSTQKKPAPVPAALTSIVNATPQSLFQKAIQNQNNKDLAISYYNQALQLATQNIKANPTSPQAWYDRGWLYATVMYSYPSFIPNAISDLRHASQNSETYQILANLYTAQGDLSSALAYHQLLGNTTQIKTIQSLLDQASVGAGFPRPIKGTPRPIKGTPRPTVLPTLSLDSPLEQTSLPNLIIASPNSPNPFAVSASSASNALSGQLTLAKGQSTLILKNNNITSTSLVYISPTSGGKNLPLSVISKTKGQATIGLPYTSPDDILFQFWIIAP